MRKTLILAALAAALGIARPARADFLPFTFSTTATVPVGGIDPQPTTTITYSGNSGSSTTPTDIKIGTIGLTQPTGPGPVLSPFTFDILISDTTTGGSATFNLSGLLFGSVGTNSSLIDFVFAGSQTMSLTGPGGTAVYTVSAKFIDVPTVEDDGTKQGSITATVAGVFEPDSRSVPEPSSLALCGLGAVALAGHAWRRRKARA